MTHRSGFVNIIGHPNVGKSTLMNAMVGEKLSGITAKAQTTRHRIMGIVNHDDYQIVYSDTPGILEPNYKLQETMLTYVNQAFQDADIFLYVVELPTPIEKEQAIIDKLAQHEVPVLLVINKIDLDTEGRLDEVMECWKQAMPKAEIVPVSALHKFNLEKLFGLIVDMLPESPPYYSKDAITDKSERFIASEIIREKILLNYKKEIPYSVEVEIESFKESEDLIRISSVIYVERDSQKGIMIGAQGNMLKRVGTMARKDMEQFFAKKIFLELFVKVNKDWRNSEKELKRFGYIKK
jgi:GTPase